MPSATSQPGPAPSVAPTPQDGGSSGSILVVEDDYFVALSIEEALTHVGFVVVGVAETAEQAVTMAGMTQPDLVLMDIHLRGARDGIAAAHDILQQFGIPCVFATAHDDPGTQQRATHEAQPLGWIFKPFSLRDLVATVGAAVTRARQQRSRNG